MVYKWRAAARDPGQKVDLHWRFFFWIVNSIVILYGKLSRKLAIENFYEWRASARDPYQQVDLHWW